MATLQQINFFMKLIDKPKKGEYPPYAIMYIKLVPGDGMVLHYLKNNFRQ